MPRFRVFSSSMNRIDGKIERLSAAAGDGECRETLRLVMRALPEAVRERFVEALLTSARYDADVLAELWRAEDAEGRLKGASWGQLRPGASVVVWPPQWQHCEAPAAPDPLLSSLMQSLASRDLVLAQSLLPDRNSADAAALLGCGFEHLADLTYLTAPTPTVSPAVDESISFQAVAEKDFARLADIVDQTYVGTLDCPSLNGIRRTVDVLDEYRAIGDCGADLWRIVYREGREVGCLMLADHRAMDQVELVYMGIVPAARGLGLGATLVGEALRITAQLGRKCVVLAVDCANRPALDVYLRCGFTNWESQSVFVKRLRPSTND